MGGGGNRDVLPFDALRRRARFVTELSRRVAVWACIIGMEDARLTGRRRQWIF